MSLSAKLRRAPLRVAAGAYMVNSGVTTLNVDDETAKSLHGMASATYPVLGKLEPKVFARTLAVGEIAVGTMLLLPIVPPFIAGTALVGFSGAQLNMYRDTPGMHYEGSLRLTPEGTSISETVWMFGIGVGLMTDATFEGARKGVEEIEASVARRRVEWGKRARRLVRRAQTTGAESVEHLTQQAGDASEGTAKGLAEIRAEYGPVAAEKARTAGEAVRQAAAEYGPVAAEKARTAGEAVRQAAAEYGPVAAEKARTAGEAVRQAAVEYGPVAAEKARTAGEAVRQAARSTGRWRPRRPAPQAKRFGRPRWSTGRWRPRRPAPQARRFGTPLPTTPGDSPEPESREPFGERGLALAGTTGVCHPKQRHVERHTGGCSMRSASCMTTRRTVRTWPACGMSRPTTRA